MNLKILFLQTTRRSFSPQFGDYHDEYGNHIHCKSCRIILAEAVGNTSIMVHDTATFDTSARINVLGSNSKMVIGEKCSLSSLQLNLRLNSTLNINEGTTMANNGFISLHLGESVYIGKDCMFSYDTKIFAGDGHAILDLNTCERTNPPTILKDSNSHSIEISDHVWIGVRSTILNGSIGRSSIVGAGAIVKGHFPNNCIIAGVPAKIIRKNITWSRNVLCDNISQCGENNLNPTEEI